MVDETGEVATLRSIYNGVVIDSEHVAAADALLLVALLPHVSNYLEKIDNFRVKQKGLSDTQIHESPYYTIDFWITPHGEQKVLRIKLNSRTVHLSSLKTKKQSQFPACLL